MVLSLLLLWSLLLVVCCIVGLLFCFGWLSILLFLLLVLLLLLLCCCCVVVVLLLLFCCFVVVLLLLFVVCSVVVFVAVFLLPQNTPRRKTANWKKEICFPVFFVFLQFPISHHFFFFICFYSSFFPSFPCLLFVFPSCSSSFCFQSKKQTTKNRVGRTEQKDNQARKKEEDKIKWDKKGKRRS